MGRDPKRFGTSVLCTRRCFFFSFLFLGTQKDELESSLTDLFTSCEFVEKALEHGTDTEVLLVKKQVGIYCSGVTFRNCNVR